MLFRIVLVLLVLAGGLAEPGCSAGTAPPTSTEATEKAVVAPRATTPLLVSYESYDGRLWVRPIPEEGPDKDTWVWYALGKPSKPPEHLPLALAATQRGRTLHGAVRVHFERFVHGRADLNAYVHMQHQSLRALAVEHPNEPVTAVLTFAGELKASELMALLEGSSAKLELLSVGYDAGDHTGYVGIAAGVATGDLFRKAWYRYFTATVGGEAQALVALISRPGVAAVDVGALEEQQRLRDLGVTVAPDLPRHLYYVFQELAEE